MANELTKRVMRTIVERCGRQGVYTPMAETSTCEGVTKHAAYERTRGQTGRPSNRPSSERPHLTESESQVLSSLLNKGATESVTPKTSYSARTQSSTKPVYEAAAAEKVAKVELPSSGTVRLDDLVRQVKR